jgi:hypothetical protein
MPKAMSLSGIVVAILLLLVFGLDLALQIPFSRASWGIDVAFIICALLLGYMSWSTFRQQR